MRRQFGGECESSLAISQVRVNRATFRADIDRKSLLPNCNCGKALDNHRGICVVEAKSKYQNHAYRPMCDDEHCRHHQYDQWREILSLFHHSKHSAVVPCCNGQALDNGRLVYSVSQCFSQIHGGSHVVPCCTWTCTPCTKIAYRLCTCSLVGWKSVLASCRYYSEYKLVHCHQHRRLSC